MDPGYKEGKTGRGATSLILPRMKQYASIAPLGQKIIPYIGHGNISLHPEQPKGHEIPLIPIQTLTKGRACYVVVVNPRICNINPTRLHFAFQQQKDIPKPIIKGSQNWLNYTLEEYSNFIFAHGRYNTLENLDLKIRNGLEIVDLIDCIFCGQR